MVLLIIFAGSVWVWFAAHVAAPPEAVPSRISLGAELAGRGVYSDMANVVDLKEHLEGQGCYDAPTLLRLADDLEPHGAPELVRMLRMLARSAPPGPSKAKG